MESSTELMELVNHMEWADAVVWEAVVPGCFTPAEAGLLPTEDGWMAL